MSAGLSGCHQITALLLNFFDFTNEYRATWKAYFPQEQVGISDKAWGILTKGK